MKDLVVQRPHNMTKIVLFLSPKASFHFGRDFIFLLVKHVLCLKIDVPQHFSQAIFLLDNLFWEHFKAVIPSCSIVNQDKSYSIQILLLFLLLLVLIKRPTYTNKYQQNKADKHWHNDKRPLRSSRKVVCLDEFSVLVNIHKWDDLLQLDRFWPEQTSPHRTSNIICPRWKPDKIE